MDNPVAVHRMPIINHQSISYVFFLTLIVKMVSGVLGQVTLTGLIIRQAVSRKKIAVELVQSLCKSLTVDWAVRAWLRVMVKTELKRYKYPPDKQEKATETVHMQAESLSADWVAA